MVGQREPEAPAPDDEALRLLALAIPAGRGRLTLRGGLPVTGAHGAEPVAVLHDALLELHRLAQADAIFCRSSQKKAPAEWQADRFAAALLMPAADVRATVRALCGDTLPTWEDVEAKRKARVLDEKLRDLATEVMAKGNFTNVSNEAMRYRLLDLNLVLDASNPQRSLL